MKRHGDVGTSLYTRWNSMKTRCNNDSATDYTNYGGRGISYHTDFELYPEYKAHILSIGYEIGTKLQIDRIDNDGDYTYGNLRMVTRSTNNRNRREHKVSGAVPFKGVSFDTVNSKYRARVYVEGKEKHLGRYLTAFEAACVVANFKNGE